MTTPFSAFLRPARRALLARALGLVLVTIGLGPADAIARVLELEIERRVPILEGYRFPRDASDRSKSLSKSAGVAKASRGAGLAYELIEGRVRFSFDPNSPANARVTDIGKAPLGPSGGVEADADFLVLQPLDPERRSGTALVDVPNRGRRLALSGFNRVDKAFTAAADLDPADPADWGDGFLMSHGLTIVWVGWQADAPTFPGAMGLRVPRAREDDGRPIRGLARSDWVVDEATDTLALAALGHAPHRVADPSDSRNRLTRRPGRNAPRELVPRAEWRFSETGEAIVAPAGFEPGWIYELVYAAEGPPLVGLGFAAFRDLTAYARHDPRAPFPITRAIAHGLSQSGRFLRHFLYDGFNTDEAGKTVFDAMMIQIGGAGRGGFNHRFSHPGRVGNPYENFFYPGDQFPFTSRAIESDGERAGLLDRVVAQGAMPRIFQINTGYEYWGRGASLIHMTPDGTRDVAPLARERLYHLASAPHYSLPFPPEPRAEIAPGLFLGSSVDTSGAQRALLVRMLDWVEHDVSPPKSRIPTIAAGTLVPPAELDYPLPSLTPVAEGAAAPPFARPRSPHVADRLYFGPRFENGIIDLQPPTRSEPYAIRVPQIDALGSEATGIRSLELRVPIGTYLPWALRFGKPGGRDEMTGYIGTFLPLATSASSRRPGDRRPDLQTLYPTREVYEAQLASEIDALVDAGFLLPRDRPAAFNAGVARWDWIQARASD